LKILNLNIHNFLTIGNLVELSLEDKGLCLIQGENRDDTSATSNGAGKSTIGDSISWCLYGITARGETGDSIINNIAKKECCVEVTVESDGKIYAIARYRKSKKYKNSLQVKNMTDVKDLTKGTDKLTQEVVEQIIGCSYEVFKSAIYAGQDSIPNLPGMTDKFLKQIVEESAGINRLGLAHDKAKDQFKVKESALMKSEDNLISAKNNLQIYKDRIDELKDKDAQLIIDNDKKVVNLGGEIALLQAKADILKRKISKIDKRAIEKEIDATNSSLKMGVVKYQASTKAVNEATSAQSMAEAVLKTIMSDAKKKVANVKGIESKEGQPCGECGKPYLKEDLSDIVKIARAKLLTVKTEINKANQALNAAKIAKRSAASELSSLDDTSVQINKNKVAVSLLQHKLNKGSSLQSDLDSICKDYLAKQAQIKDIEGSESPYVSMIDKACGLYDDVIVRIDTLKVAIEKQTHDADLAKDAVAVFSPAGVRAHVLDTVTPQLNERTSHYLSILSDGNISAVWNTLSKTKSGELREKFTIEVENETGSKNFGGLSGGEKRKVRLATAMALQDLVSSRASKPISLWIADEIDDALDEAGLERLMTVLEEKAREKGTVLMISHNSLSDWIRSETTVIKESGVVTVVGDLVAR